MKRYLIFVIDSESGTANEGEMEQIDDFNAGLQANGQLLTAIGIAGPSAATSFDNRDGAGRRVSPGSLNSPQEYYSGFWLINAEDDEEAAELAAKASRACNRRVELRPMLGG